MDIIRRDFLRLMGATGAAASLPLNLAFGAQYPSRPITAAVTTAQGGGVDTVMRNVEPLIERELGGATVNVINKTGGTGSIATQFIYTQPSDGYWWLACAGFNRGLRILDLHPTVPYLDWQFFGADTSIASVGVLPDSPIKDMNDLIKRGRDEPDKLRMSTNGLGGTWHLAAVLVMRDTKAKYRIVPYKGGLPATKAALEGEVDVAVSGLHEQLPFIKAGKLRNLCVMAPDTLTVQGVTLEPIGNYIPTLKPLTPIGGGMSLAVKRDVDPGIIKQLSTAWKASIDSKEFHEIDAKKPRFPDPVILEAADRRAALWECVAANLLAEQGLAKKTLKELNIPDISEFDAWWPPKGYKPVAA